MDAGKPLRRLVVVQLVGEESSMDLWWIHVYLASRTGVAVAVETGVAVETATVSPGSPAPTRATSTGTTTGTTAPEGEADRWLFQGW